MKASTTATITRILAIIIGVVLVVLPFHAFLSIWLASAVGHYTLLRLWKEFVLAIVGVIAVGLLLRDKPMLQSLRKHQLFGLIAVYVLLVLFLGFTAFAHHQVSAKALAYGLLDDLRYVLFFVLVAGIAARDSWLRNHWQTLLLTPAMLVVLFGLLQIFVLPHNFLAHFGYGPNTVTAYQTVNSNNNLVRAQSTLRGANPLGAYLVLILVIVGVLGLKSKTVKQRWLYAIAGLATLLVLFFTYSRSAWLGVVVGLVFVGLLAIRSLKIKQWLGVAVIAVLLVGGVSAWVLRHNAHFEDVFLHTAPHTVATTSDQNHSSALRQGLDDLKHDPLGRGPGTAGPASAYNTKRPDRDPEDYFIQIGQEVGWLGLALFLLINVVIGVELYRTRKEPLAIIMFASLLGLSAVGLLGYVWSDDTLSYIWWGLAGIALAPYLLESTKKHA